MRPRHFIGLALALITLDGCRTADSSWYYNYEGNPLAVSIGKTRSANFIDIKNTERTWRGRFTGGKEMIAARKQFLSQLAARDSQNYCNGGYARILGEPYFDMQDRDPMFYGGGLIGVGLSYAFTSDDNIPVSIGYEFTCN